MSGYDNTSLLTKPSTNGSFATEKPVLPIVNTNEKRYLTKK